MSIVNILVGKKQLNIQEMEQQEVLESLYQKEAIAELDEQQVDLGLCLCLCLCPCLCLYLCPSEEEGEVQPAALPNEQEDADILEQQMDSHSADQHEN